VYYINDAEPNISRVPLDGTRKPEVMFRFPQGYITVGGAPLVISPDGMTFATSIGSFSDTRIALFKLGSSSPWRLLSPNHLSRSGLQFTHGEKSIAYVSREKGVDNVWLLPLDGSAGHPITDFKSEQIWSFSLSPDGKSLAILRGRFDSDVVLLHESKQ